MKKTGFFERAVIGVLVLLMGVPPGLYGQQAGQAAAFKQEVLDQLLAPIALHPDSLISQILMASTYPLEVVQAEPGRSRTRASRGTR